MLAQDGLDSYQWKNRLVLVHGAENHQATQEQISLLQSVSAELEERNLLVFLLDPKLKEVTIKHGNSQVPLNYESIIKERNIDPQYFQVLLIGKDGGIKMRRSRLVSPSWIFAMIDKMPMRQAEMRKD